MMISGALQLSLVSTREWSTLYGRIDSVKRRSMAPIRSLSMSVLEAKQTPMVDGMKRCASLYVKRPSWSRRGTPDVSDVSRALSRNAEKEKAE